MLAPLLPASTKQIMLFTEIKRHRWLRNYNKIRESSFKKMEKPVNVQDYIVYDKENNNDE